VTPELPFPTLPRRPGRWRSYAEYLASERWAELRAAALERDGHRCRFCDSNQSLEVHHRRYPEEWGTETVDDLTTTCADCHVVLSWFRDRTVRANSLRLARA
jgi:predicted HNH restriction endonuclease